MKRRKQFTIKTSRMSDEVYEFFEQLSRKGEFTRFIIQCGEEELKKTKGCDDKQPLDVILEELQEIKSLILSKHIHFSSASKIKENQEEQELEEGIVKLSSDFIVSSLDDDDVDYNF